MAQKSAPSAAAPFVFSGYEKFVIALLAFLQFTVVLDFMILAPLGAFLLQDLKIAAHEFGFVVSAYAFSAAASGFLAATFADYFDRKRLLLTFYVGFLVGTFLCGVATSFAFLVVARIVAGLFGGVLGSISFAIVADLFPLEVRGRVMGVLQSGFAASQVLGIPLGLFLANRFGWHSPFLVIASAGTAVGCLVALRLKPMRGHLQAAQGRSPLRHLLDIATKPRHVVGFSAMILVATGGFMLQPFASAFTVNNLGVPPRSLPVVYVVTGIVALIAGPSLGRAADSIGKYRVFWMATLLGCFVIVWYTSLGLSPLWLVVLVNALLAVAIAGRMVSSVAMISAVPAPSDRGAYMAVSSSLQQLAGGVSSSIAGLVVTQTAAGRIQHFSTLGWIVVGAMVVTLGLMWRVHRTIRIPAV